MSAKNDVSSRFIAALECLLGENIVSDKKAFAAKLGISPSMITEIYKGRSAVGTTAIQNIVRVFNISGDWLLTGEGDMLKSAPSGTTEASEGAPEATTAPAPCEKNNQPKATKGKKQNGVDTAESTNHPMALLVEKVAQQAEEIGRLKEQIRQLIAQKEHNASTALSSDIANVG